MSLERTQYAEVIEKVGGYYNFVTIINRRLKELRNGTPAMLESDPGEDLIAWESAEEDSQKKQTKREKADGFRYIGILTDKDVESENKRARVTGDEGAFIALQEKEGLKVEYIRDLEKETLDFYDAIIIPNIGSAVMPPVMGKGWEERIRNYALNGGAVMRAWYDIVETDVSRQVDVDSILASAQLLNNLIQRELDNGVPSEKILLAGFSQGGVIVLHTALRHAKPLAGILAMSTYLPTVDSLETERSEANRNIPIFMAHGQNDPVIPIVNAENTREALARLDYNVELRTYPMEHHVCIEEIADIRTWLLEVLQPTSS